MPPKPQKPEKSANEVAYTKKRGKRITKGGVVLANLVSPGARGRGNVPEGKPTALKADRNKRAIGTYVDLAFAADALKKPAEEITPEELAEWQASKPGWGGNSARKAAMAALEKATQSAIDENSIALGVRDKGPLYNDWLQTGGIDWDNTQYNKELKSNQIALSRFQYQEGDENSTFFANLPPEQISQIQKNLVGMKATGFKGKYIDGLWDTKTAKAFKEVLTEANYQNTTWDVIMADYAATTASSGSRGPGGGGGGRGGPIEDIEAIRQMFDSISGEVSGKNVSVIDRERLSREVLNEMTLADQNGEQYQVEERMRRKLKENDPGGAAENDALSVFNSFARMMGQGGMFGAGSAQQPITNSPATGAGGPA